MKPTWTIVISAVASALVFAGGTYYLVNAKTTKDKNNLQSQINDLNTKYSEAQSTLSDLQAASTSSSATTGSTSTATTGSTSLSDSSSTVDPTSGWQTYTNSTYGYSIKYPAEFTVNVLGSDMINIKMGSVANAALLASVGVDGSVTSFKSSQTLDAVVAQMKANGQALDSYATTIGSVPAYELTWNGPDSGTFSVIAKNNNHLYELSFENLPAVSGSTYTTSQAWADLPSTDKEMIKSFAFTK